MRKTIASFALIGVVLTIRAYSMDLEDGTRVYNIMEKYKYRTLCPIDIRHTQEDVMSFLMYREEAKAKNPLYGELLQAIENQNYGKAISITEKLPNDQYKFLGASWSFFLREVPLKNDNYSDYKEDLEKAKSLYEKTHAEVREKKSEWVSDILYRLAIDADKLTLKDKSDPNY
ncbi:MAG: hypothetical protein LBB63_00600 [Holosporaceae bacterium]|jgi:hypothetical protein|nr:hypothetical protein [Holosporaceae bacterium]